MHLVVLQIHGNELIHQLVEVSLTVVRGWHVAVLVRHLDQEFAECRNHLLRVGVLVEVLLVVLDEALKLLKHLVLR